MTVPGPACVAVVCALMLLPCAAQESDEWRKHFELGNRLLDSGHAADAIRSYSEAIRLAPENAAAFTQRGRAKSVLRDLEGAIRDYSEAIRLEPANSPAWRNRGDALSDKGEFHTALADYDECLRLTPADSTALVNRGVAQTELGNLDAAIADYSEALRIRPESVPAWNNRAQVRLRRGELEMARADLEEALRRDRANSLVWSNLACLESLSGEHEKAYQGALRSLETASLGEDSRYGALLVLAFRLRSGSSDAVPLAARAALRFRDGEDDWPARLGQLLTGDAAVEDLVKELDPTSSRIGRERACEAWFYAGILRLARGDAVAAREAFRMCVATDAAALREHLLARDELRRLEEGK